MDFDKKAHEIFRNWYVDGKIYYHKVIDLKKPEDGIKELRYIDPLKIKFIRKLKKTQENTLSAQVKSLLNNNNFNEDLLNPEIEEYYVYDPNVGYSPTTSNLQSTEKAIKLTKDSVTSVTSGLVDRNRQTILSYLHKAIKALNQLRMIEDSIVIYRLSRASEKRLFYIDVGNLPKIKAEQYMRDVMNRYRNKLVYDACLSMDTRVPLLDGRTLTLSQITEEFNKGERLWAYSCDPNTGKFAPGVISWAGITRKNEKVMKITLDNDETITCTLDHKFPVWNKGLIEAKDLEIGTSMIPFYSRKKEISSNSKNSTYQQIYENETKKWKFVHRLVSNWKDGNNLLNEFVYNLDRALEDKHTVHHINYNRYDNTPENLVRMSRDDHFDYHKQHSHISGKIGGKVTAQKKREAGIPMFNLTDEQRSELGKRNGKVSGKNAYENKLGIHGLPKEKTIENSKKGNDKLLKLLKTDKDFYEKYCETIRNSWGEEQRLAAAERAKNRPKEHFIKMNVAAIDALWNSETSNERREKLSKKQTIEYTQEIYDMIDYCVKNNYKFEETIDYINQNINFVDWISLNSNKTPRRGKSNNSPFEKFSYSNLTNVCKNLGFNSWKEYKNSFVYKNHKIKNIEYLDETIDVGTLTIDREEIYHNYHTFALEAGIYTCNSTGEIRDDRKYMAMLEDYWLPRREGGRGTEVSTLPGGQNLGELADIEYFQKKLYKSLGVPSTRLDAGGGFNLGRSSEILRDELKFTRFVGRLRKRFSQLFVDMLKTQLILKNIVTPEDWNILSDHIQFDFLYDNHFSELKKNEIMNDKLGVVSAMDPFIGKYFSIDYIRREILNQSDDEIIEINKQIEKEMEEGLIANPADMMAQEQGMEGQQAPGNVDTLGSQVKEPGISTSNTEPGEI